MNKEELWEREVGETVLTPEEECFVEWYIEKELPAKTQKLKVEGKPSWHIIIEVLKFGLVFGFVDMRWYWRQRWLEDFSKNRSWQEWKADRLKKNE